MGLLIGLLQAAITFGAIALIIFLVANLFILVFSFAGLMDKRVNNQ